MPGADIETLSVQMTTSGIATQLEQHGHDGYLIIVRFIVSSSMSVFGASVSQTNLNNISLLTSTICGVIPVNI
jgi:hypothetical protein